ncbi:hypothetical protein CYMTET_29891 [Cymbomonas tetramitiformis]|uniref:Uncharacterized protein n=1 Tax=Cymbomonas tetramitiformis TaxID=36881 RepID=A0AAE0FK42_9CHLO|nr:hypothetical protein CYMTET_29891 [Cymbomonas tetramitiformis]
MGVGGLKGIYPSVDAFGAQELRRLSTFKLVRAGEISGAYFAEFSMQEAGQDRRVITLVSVGCRGSETARKFNLQHTITMQTSFDNNGKYADDSRDSILSFNLTVGPFC